MKRFLTGFAVTAVFLVALVFVCLALIFIIYLMKTLGAFYGIVLIITIMSTIVGLIEYFSGDDNW